MVLAFIWIMLLFILQCCSTNYVDNVHLFCLFYSGVGLTMVIAFIWIMFLFILQWCSTNHGDSVHLDHVVALCGRDHYLGQHLPFRHRLRIQ